MSNGYGVDCRYCCSKLLNFIGLYCTCKLYIPLTILFLILYLLYYVYDHLYILYIILIYDN